MAKIKLILKISLIIVAGAGAVWVFLNVLQINLVYIYSYQDVYGELLKDFDIIEKLVLTYEKNRVEVSPEDKALVIKAITQLTAELLYYQDWLVDNKLTILFTKEDIDIMINNITRKLNLLDNYLYKMNDDVNHRIYSSMFIYKI